MEIYYTNRITGKAGQVSNWSRAPGYPALLAVSYGNNAVGIYNEEALPLDPNNLAIIKNVRGTECHKLAWHPTLPLLVIGWKDGAISFWNYEERKLEEDSKIHRVSLRCLKWTPNGERLITADENGRISIWKTDRLMRPIHVVAYDEPGQKIHHVVVGAPETHPDTNSPITVVYYSVSANDMASIKWCNDHGYSGLVQELGEDVHSLVFYPEKHQLLVVGSTCTLNVLVRDEQLLTWSSMTKMKFATGTGEAATGLSVVWAGNHTLASASERDNAIRMYNFDTEDNYMLPLEPSDSGAVSRIVTLNYDERFGLLAAGTSDGRVIVHAYNGAGSQSASNGGSGGVLGGVLGEPLLDLSKSWDVQPAFSVHQRPLSLEWGLQQRLMRVTCADGVSVCRKTLLNKKLRDRMAVMQLGVDRLMLEAVERAPTGSGTTGMGGAAVSAASSGVLCEPAKLALPACQILGLDYSKGILLIYTGQRAELFKVVELNVSDTGASMGMNGDSGMGMFGGARLANSGAAGGGRVKLSVSPAGSFETSSRAMAINNDSIYRSAEGKLEVLNLAGVVKQTIVFDDEHDARQATPVALDVGSGGHLALVSARGLVRVYKVAGREAKPHAGPGNLLPPHLANYSVTFLRCNGLGNLVACVACHPDNPTQTRQLVVWCSESSTTLTYNFAKDLRVPVAVSWDTVEPKMLVVQMAAMTGAAAVAAAASLSSASDATAAGGEGETGATGGAKSPEPAAAVAPGSKSGPSQELPPPLDIALMFVNPEKGIMLQEYHPINEPDIIGCVGSAAPYILLMRKQKIVFSSQDFMTSAPAAAADGAGGSAPGEAGYGVVSAALAGSSAVGPPPNSVTKMVMLGFAGLQDSDDKTRRALLDFSYHMAAGNTDDAFRAVRAVRSAGVWANMAHLCVKNKRLDVAEQCLGNLQHTRGARALREAEKLEESDARVAAVAVHLGMVEDAKKLYAGCERYDLLSQLYCACGQWDKALEVVEKQDRIHLKSTRYQYAKFLESSGDLEGAQQQFELSGCAIREVPRLLMLRQRQGDSQAMHRLKAYVMGQENRELTQWWGRYLESLPDVEAALDIYRKIGDSLSTVRVLCSVQNLSAAEEEVANSGDLAAAFHLARTFEALGRMPEAIRYYTASKRYGQGVHLAKSCGLQSDLVNLALKSPPAVMIDTADYLNEKGLHEQAALLYMKGGRLGKAVEMCIQGRLFDVLQHITDGMDLAQGQGGQQRQPELYVRCAEFFIEHGQNAKAARMLVAAGQPGRALELCVEHDVTVDEELAEAMTPNKDEVPADQRNAVLARIAKVCKRQGSFQLAAKKYTQAGEKVKAMKALIKSGDTEKVVFFAGVSRQKEIYLMAANYLQTLNWHSDAEVMRHIVQFLTKAQAPEALAQFYEACAQIEIDEYRDYEKALQAMREASKCLGKSRSPDKDARLAALAQRTGAAEMFVRARQLMGSAPQEASAICAELLDSIPDSQDLESGIRVGDVFAMLVEYHYQQRDAVAAFKLIEQMQRRGIVLSPYLDQHMVDEIYKALGVEPVDDSHRLYSRKAVGGAAARGGGYAAGDDDEEEVPDELDD